MKILKNRNTLWTANFSWLTAITFITQFTQYTICFILGFDLVAISNNPAVYSIYQIISNIISLLTPIIIGSFIENVSKIMILKRYSYYTAITSIIFIIVDIFLPNNAFIILIAYTIYNILSNAYLTTYYSTFTKMLDENLHQKAFSIAGNITLFASVAELVALAMYRNIEIKLSYAFIFISSIFCGLFTSKADFNEVIYNNSVTESKNLTNILKNSVETLNIMEKTSGAILMMLCFFADSIIYGGFSALCMPFLTSASYGGISLNGDLIYAIGMTLTGTGFFYGSLFNYFIKTKPKTTIILFIITFFLEIICNSLIPLVGFILMLVMLFAKHFARAIHTSINETVAISPIPEEINSRYTGLKRSVEALGRIVGNVIAGISISFFTYEVSFLLVCIPMVIVLVYMLIFKNKELVELF